MFMEREELIYGVKLGKEQFNGWGRPVSVFAIVPLFFISMCNFMPLILDHFLGGEWILPQTVGFSMGTASILAIMLLQFYIWENMYKIKSEAVKIYPQTNKSSFIATIIPEYGIIICGIIVSILINLSLFVVLPLLATYQDNTILVESLKAKDILVNAIVAFGYGLLFQSIIGLIYSLVRKFKIWCICIYMLPMIWLVYDLNTFFTFVFQVIGFYGDETSLVLFIIKVVVTHIILNTLSYFLGVHTENNNRKMRGKELKGFIVVMLVMILTLTGVIMFSLSELTDETAGVDLSTEEAYEVSEQISLDVSYLEKGSVIKIETAGNIELCDEIEEIYSTEEEYCLYLESMDELVVDGDTLVLNYNVVVDTVEENDEYSYLQPELTYELQGDVLKLEYECENPDVTILYVKSEMLDVYIEDDGVYISSGYYYSPATLSIAFE